MMPCQQGIDWCLNFFASIPTHHDGMMLVNKWLSLLVGMGCKWLPLSCTHICGEVLWTNQSQHHVHPAGHTRPPIVSPQGKWVNRWCHCLHSSHHADPPRTEEPICENAVYWLQLSNKHHCALPTGDQAPGPSAAGFLTWCAVDPKWHGSEPLHPPNWHSALTPPPHQGYVLSLVMYTRFMHDFMTTWSSKSLMKFVDNTVIIVWITGSNDTAYREEVRALTSPNNTQFSVVNALH